MKAVAILTLVLYYTASVVAQPKCNDSPPDWQDRLKNSCSWYAEYGTLRCAWAARLASRSNNLSAADVCCACGGGETLDPHPNVGQYYIQSKVNQRYLGLDNEAKVDMIYRRNSRSLLTVQAGPAENTYFIRFVNGRYLSFEGTEKVSTWGAPGSWEVFEWEDIDSINPDDTGVALKNQKWGTYLKLMGAVVKTATSSTEAGATLNVIKVSDGDVVEDTA